MKIRYTVMLKIVSAMAAAFIVAAVIGGAGLYSVDKTFADVASVYNDNLLAINDVADVRSSVSSIRSSISRALIVQSSDEAKETSLQIEALERSESKAWQRYYPAKVTSDEEMAAALHFAAAKSKVEPLLEEEKNYLLHSKWDLAKELMLTKLDAALNSEKTVIGDIVQENQRQAQTAFDEAGQRHRHTVFTIIVGLVIGAIVLVAASFFLLRAVTRPLSQARELASQISLGRLNNDLLVAGNDEFSDTLGSLSSMDTELSRIVRVVRDNAEQVASAAANIAQGNDDLSQRTQEQAAALEQTASSMEQMSASVKQNADGASLAKSFASSLSSDAEEGFNVAHAAVQAMGQISTASNNIAEMAVSIDEIAFQINLLSLNAAVEAARAGDQGRGFAVVAAEVRRLAHRSAEAAKQIKVLIAESTECVQRGTDLTDRTGISLDSIRNGAVKVSQIVAEIAAASAEQANGIDQVTSAITTLDEVTQQNAALVEEASAASHNAMALAQELQDQISFFSMSEGHHVAVPTITASQRNGNVAIRYGIAAPEDHNLGTGWKEF